MVGTFYVVVSGPMALMQFSDHIHILIPSTVTRHEYLFALSADQTYDLSLNVNYRITGVPPQGSIADFDRTQHVMLPRATSSVDLDSCRSIVTLPRARAVLYDSGTCEAVHFGGTGTHSIPQRPATLLALQYDNADIDNISVGGDIGQLQVDQRQYGVLFLVGVHDPAMMHSATKAFNQMMQLLPESDLEMLEPERLTVSGEFSKASLPSGLDTGILNTVTSLGSRECLHAAVIIP